MSNITNHFFVFVRRMILSLVAGFVLLSIAPTSRAADIVLTLATLPSGNHKYFHRLLEESLKGMGHSVKIQTIDGLPQPRIMLYLERGDITLHWFLQTRERDAKYASTDHRLTQGLIGQRLMLIPKGEDATYSRVKTLDDLIALGKVAGMGKGWFDADVWRENDMKLVEIGGDWKVLYAMVASKTRGIDYFPRGVTEIGNEAKDYPTLTIEPHLLLVYPRDLSFYLSKPHAGLKRTLDEALAYAEKSGLQKRLLAEYFGQTTADLHLDRRTVINLKNPSKN